MTWARHLRKVFYGEIVINLISILSFFFIGEATFNSLGVAQAQAPLIEVGRWFATLTLVITYILARTLASRNDAMLRFVLEGYLIGDLIYLAVVLQFVNAVGGVWTGGTLFAVGITVFLATVRVVYLRWG